MKFLYEGEEYSVGPIRVVQMDDPEYLELLEDFHCLGEVIPKGFRWDGASSPNTPIARYVAPKYYKNIKASCYHDWMCSKAKSDGDRKEADKWYYVLKKHVEKDGSVGNKLSWLGVRVGAFFGFGSNY